MNTPVTFEIAKLLKEKGFNKIVKHYYPDDGSLLNRNKGSIRHIAYRIQAPTIAEVIMWLYEKHGIWISVDYDYITFDCTICVKESNIKLISTLGEATPYCFTKPTEAYEAAIEHTLSNLI